MPQVLPPPLVMARELVAFDTVSSADLSIDRPNEPLIGRLAEWATAAGFSLERPAVSEGKQNLVATLGAGAPGLVLAGHTDTVPCDPALWGSDPWVATERDGSLYGLGTADMKSFLALALHAALRFPPSALKRSLVLVGTSDEESSMAGARALVASGRALGRAAIIGEPTSLRPVRAHKGVFFDTVTLRGRSGHSSNPALGRNALEGMLAVMNALVAYRAELEARFRDDAFEVPLPTLNLGKIRGGDAPNRICGDCELAFDLRLVPGMDPDVERAEIRRRVERAIAGRGLDVSFQTSFDGVPPFMTSADSAIVRAVESLTGIQAGVVGFATEGPFFNAAGAETVILGPGSIDVAHQPNEHIALAAFPRTIDLLERAIHRFCVDVEDLRS